MAPAGGLPPLAPGEGNAAPGGVPLRPGTGSPLSEPTGTPGFDKQRAASLSSLLRRRDSPSSAAGTRVVVKKGGEKWLGCSPENVWVLRKGEVAEVVETRGDCVKLRGPDGRVSPWVFSREYDVEDPRATSLDAVQKALEAVGRWAASGDTAASRLRGDLQRLQQSVAAVATEEGMRPQTAPGAAAVVADGRGTLKRTRSEAAKEFGELGEGAYLSFDAQGHGTLLLTWSKERIDGALLYAHPQKPVPAFKYKGTGRQELVRGCQREKKAYFRGFAEFVKAAFAYDSTLQYADMAAAAPLPTALLFRRGDGGVERMQEKGDPVALVGCDVVAAVPFANKELDGGKSLTIAKQIFVQKGNDHGAAITLA